MGEEQNPQLSMKQNRTQRLLTTSYPKTQRVQTTDPEVPVVVTMQLLMPPLARHCPLVADALSALKENPWLQVQEVRLL